MKPEAELLKDVLDHLAVRRILAYRMNSGATLASYKGKTRMVRYGVPGMADVLAFPVERPVFFKGIPPYELIICRIRPTWLEIKSPKGKQSELQKSFQAQVEAEGHVYALIYSIGDLERVL